MENFLLGLSAFFMFVIAALTWQIRDLNKRLTHYTGAMETHSTLMLRIAAKQEEIPVKWWDPTVAERPKITGPHDTGAELDTIFIKMDERDFARR